MGGDIQCGLLLVKVFSFLVKRKSRVREVRVCHRGTSYMVFTNDIRPLSRCSLILLVEPTLIGIFFLTKTLIGISILLFCILQYINLSHVSLLNYLREKCIRGLRTIRCIKITVETYYYIHTTNVEKV